VGWFLGAIVGGINCGRGKRAPTNPLWELGLEVIGQLIILDLIDISHFESKMYIQEDNWFEGENVMDNTFIVQENDFSYAPNLDRQPPR
jgi:hypothetical protein